MKKWLRFSAALSVSQSAEVPRVNIMAQMTKGRVMSQIIGGSQRSNREHADAESIEREPLGALQLDASTQVCIVADPGQTEGKMTIRQIWLELEHE